MVCPGIAFAIGLVLVGMVGRVKLHKQNINLLSFREGEHEQMFQGIRIG